MNKIIYTGLLLFVLSLISCVDGDGETKYYDPDYKVSANIPGTIKMKESYDTLKQGWPMKSVNYRNNLTDCSYGIVGNKFPQEISKEGLIKYADVMVTWAECDQKTRTETSLDGNFALKFEFEGCPPFGQKGITYFTAVNNVIFTFTVDYNEYKEDINNFISSIAFDQLQDSQNTK
ncbi:hypothetical protein [Flammeovirga sp. SubArs3]|uniref:hypothetical protein n=1 Tax=Flammeovirga sp. SubArs3 TaxID=2995316 RepID=UPI00248AD07E|nr:hypothetical protein [Flammeovirga sp. SubArs3]